MGIMGASIKQLTYNILVKLILKFMFPSKTGLYGTVYTRSGMHGGMA